MQNLSAPPRQFRGPWSPVDLLLGRLERVRRSGDGWTSRCPGPNHSRGDKNPSLSIGEGHDERVLLHCFAGCSVEEVTSAIGLELADLFPPREIDNSPPVRRHRRPEPEPIPLGPARNLMRTPEFSFTWEAAKLLALFEPRSARGEVLRSWDYLADRCDIGLLLRTAYMIRGVATLRYCDAQSVSGAISDAVKRLLEEVHR